MIPLTRSLRETRSALAVAIGGVCAVCGWLIWRNPAYFWQNDYQLWYSPMFEDVVRAWKSGEWPILSPYTWAAGNLGGEYQLGTFSLWHNAVLLALWSLPLSLPAKAAALAVVHLSLLAAGVVMLLRQRGARAGAAAAGALSVALSGWIMTWGAAQWFVALGGFAWLPWAWWALEKALATSSSRVRWALPAPFVYSLISAGSPFSDLMLALVALWLAARTLAATRRPRAILPILWGGLLGAALAAPGWWMLLEMNGYCVRADWGAVIQREYLVPARAWLGLVLPSVEGTWITFRSQPAVINSVVLLGGLAPLSALLTLGFQRWRRARGALLPSSVARWDLGLLAVAVLLCMVPLIGSFRWSFRWLPLFQLALAVAGTDALSRCTPVQVARTALLLLLAVAGCALLTRTAGDGRLLVAETAILLAWWGLAWRGVRWSTALAVASLAAATLSLLELKRSTFAYTFPLGENMKSPEPLDPRRLYLGVYTWADSTEGLQRPAGWGTVLRSGNTPLYAGLHFLNGYSSFFPFGVPSWFSLVGNVESEEQAQALVRPQADPLLALLGVDGLVFGNRYRALADGLGPEWDLAVSSDEATVYHRDPRRAAPAHALDAIEAQPAAALSHPILTVIRDRRQQITLHVEPQHSAPHTAEEIEDVGLLEPAVSAAGPAAIVFARPYYPGYAAEWNGAPVAVRNYLGMVPLVELPAGAKGELTLRFRPPSLRYGIPLALGALAVWTLSLLRLPRR